MKDAEENRCAETAASDVNGHEDGVFYGNIIFGLTVFALVIVVRATDRRIHSVDGHRGPHRGRSQNQRISLHVGGRSTDALVPDGLVRPVFMRGVVENAEFSGIR